MKKKHLVILIIAPILASFLAFYRVYYSYNIWTYKGIDKKIIINSGDGFSKINARLYNQKLIHSSKLFYRYCQYNKCINKFKAGEFLIKHGSTTKTILDLLLKGKSLTIKVTIPEGKNLYEIAKILKEKKIIPNPKNFIEFAKNKSMVRKFKLIGDTFEGYLYPDTYNLTKKLSPRKIVQIMVARYKQVIKRIDFSASPMNEFDILTLASIVEKETGASFERPKIAGVFLNRLKRKMRLQSDPTTIYGIFEHFNGNLRKRHLLEKTPYNTYKIPALPKGPICNPGKSAILAVLKPIKHNFLYFVSQNNGTHVFTETYKRHREAVNYYQKNSSMRKGKSWRNLNQKTN